MTDEQKPKPPACNSCGCVVGTEGIHLHPAVCVKALKRVLKFQSRGLDDISMLYGQTITNMEQQVQRMKRVTFLALRRMPGCKMVLTTQEFNAVAGEDGILFNPIDSGKMVEVVAVQDPPAGKTTGKAS